MTEALGRASRNARTQAGKRVAHVAAALDKDTATIQRFERGQTTPRNIDEFVAVYAECLGIKEQELWVAALELYLGNLNGKS